MTGFRETLKEAVKQMAFKTSLDSLKKKGVKEVSVLGIDRIIALIDEAVHRSLKTRMFGIEREAVAESTKAEFLRMLKSNEDLQKSKGELELLKERAEDEVDMLRRELENQRGALERKLEQGELERRSQYEGEDQRIAGQVQELFRLMAAQPDTNLGQVQDQVLAMVLQLVTSERKAAADARSALRDREVDTLQRRIAKLSSTLEQTEDRLKQAAAMKHIDDGISSIYREVQGLASSATDYTRKKELMAEIFKANLKLQKGAGS